MADPVLTRMEVLERDLWAIKVMFADLLQEDTEFAGVFLEWAVKQWEEAIRLAKQ